MAYDIQEQESIAELKAFWDKAAKPVTTTLTIAALIVLGVQGWRYYQGRQSAQAAALYEDYQRKVAAKDDKGARERAAAITSQYASSAYAALASLGQARASFDAGDLTAAKAQLHWVIDHGGEKDFVALARVRLAGVLLDEKAYDEALALLAGDAPAGYASQYADRRGDILVAQGKFAAAREAYTQAVAQSGAQDPLRAVIQAKLDALTGAS